MNILQILQIAKIHIQIVHRIARLSPIDFPHHGEDGFHTERCARRYVEIVVPCRFCILLTCQLKNWLRVQVVAPKLHCFGQQVSLCSTRSQPPDCRSLLNLLLLDATGFPATSPSIRQGMHLFVALEKSTLRRMSLVQYSSCCRVSPKLSASPDFQVQSDSMRWRNLSQ